MFTGLIQHLVQVDQASKISEGMRLKVRRPANEALQLGESIAINGTCLTVTSFDEHHIDFFVGQESLLKTTLGHVLPGDRVNFERSLTLGDRLGGHMVSGHIDETGLVVSAEKRDQCLWLNIQVKSEQFKHMVPKGSVAINGVSLTINAVDRNAKTFEVLLIPETLVRTNLSECAAGLRVNIECDQMVKIIAHHLTQMAENGRDFFGSVP